MVRALRRKPQWAFDKEYEETSLKPSYSFTSLLLFGIGGCVGSGVFVLSGQVARTLAGPATVLSWLIAGIVCALTALSYCELAALLRTPGSAYAFAYFGLGEIFATMAFFLLSLEYGVSGAAVARSWGDKVAFWATTNGWTTCENPETDCWINAVGGSIFNPFALLISIVMVFVMFSGAKMEKGVINVLCSIKVLLVVFVIIVGAVYTDPSNLKPFIPPPNTAQNGEYLSDFTGGINGVFVGATSAFFGLVGFDEVTCMTQEALRPKKDIPRAVLATIGTISIMYMAASLVLTGMVPYEKISTSEGFGSAFMAVGADWAMQITLAGEILVILPTVILVSYIPQARLMYATAMDGQLPSSFRRVTSKGTLVYATLFMGVICTLMAALIPFQYLNDLISAGVLLSFVFTNSSLILTRSKNKSSIPLLGFVLTSLLFCLILNKAPSLSQPVVIACVTLSGLSSVAFFCVLACKYEFPVEHNSFAVPWVPLVPGLSIYANSFLLTQTSFVGLGSLILFVSIATIVYFLYGIRRTVDFDLVKEINVAGSKHSTDSPVEQTDVARAINVEVAV
jgi:amino acid transporter